MKITLFFTGHFGFDDIKSGDEFELNEGATVADLLTAKGIQKEHQRFVIPFINGVEKRLTVVINDGDEVRLFLPVGGG
ncbi:MAG: MoaD/ThiS family protein [Spartobacteria bacterium]|nr:MoaD/ThiS family protein [Spartobacteria bacterium]